MSLLHSLEGLGALLHPKTAEQTKLWALRGWVRSQPRCSRSWGHSCSPQVGFGVCSAWEHLHTSQHIQALPEDPIFSFLPLSSCITLWLTSGYFGFLCILLPVPWTAVEWGLELMIQNCFRGKNQAVNSSAGSSPHPLLSHQSSVTLLNPKSRINRARRVFSFDTIRFLRGPTAGFAVLWEAEGCCCNNALKIWNSWKKA